MEEKEVFKEQDSMVLALAMCPIFEQLRNEKKFSALHVYQCVLRSFLRFMDSAEGSPFTLEEIFQPGTLKEYETWLRANQSSWNTVSTYIRTLRAVYNRLVRKGVLVFEPQLFENVYTGVMSLTKRSLEPEAMQKMLAIDIRLIPIDIQRTYAYFLLTFLLRGMPFIDLVHLQKGDVKGDFISYCRHKTGKQITVRISRYARELFEKFRDRNPSSPYLFPILSVEAKNADMNGRYLTDEELYLCYQRALRRFNHQLSIIGKLLFPGVSISSYTPRHTWATLVYHRGVHVGIISEALGHSSGKVTETYLKPFRNQRIDEINDELIAALIKGTRRENVTS
ncbi:phage integrase SAM-like domain-containing protein [Bacteroides sp.]|uniref:tyrosine-type recombinase/integrase n=1 Tax=Bacteroides sp. TaxID=29523 RepID=UPI0026253A63|nr:phage integrase SAM-like domain-containing protein [Bacteroides sp.]